MPNRAKGSMMKRRTIVGKLINFRGLVYSPINEQGVVFLFGKVAHEFGMYVELIRTGYPDCIAKRYIGKDRWEEIKIEFEFKSSDFVRHKHKAEDADMIVCWEHDWEDCHKSIEVLELKNEITKLENISVEASDKISKSSEYEIDEYLKRGTKESIKLFKELSKEILKIDDNIYNKTHKHRIFYYSPKRVFVNVKVLKNGLNLHLFTNAKKIKGVEAFGKEYAQKWGRLYVMNKKDLPTAIAAIKKSHKYINSCVENNITTGWYAEAKAEE
jgi:predicted transport protein|tara:strand:+ start:129 stop:941 length:813 start_codon:yes stop_codon:yes gene_type:complete